MKLFLFGLLALVALAQAGLDHKRNTKVTPTLATERNINAIFGGDVHPFGVRHSSFKKKQQMGSLGRWDQFMDGVHVFASVVTSKSNKEGMVVEVEGFHTMISKRRQEPLVTKERAIHNLKVHFGHDFAKLDGLVSWREDGCGEKFYAKEKTLIQAYKCAYFVDWLEPRKTLNVKAPFPAYIVGMVDTKTGEVIRSWNNLQHAASKVRGILGNELIGSSHAYMEADKFDRRCYHRHVDKRIEVFNMHYGTNYYESNSNFRCSRADEDDFDGVNSHGGYSPRNEAYLYANQLVDMWYAEMGNEVEIHETDSSYLRFYTHYSFRYENAFFDGEKFTFGDGESYFFPLTSLDIVCHEVGHAITQWHGGNLVYAQESGGMNEAYSDIIGETCDMYWQGKTNYLVGDGVTRDGDALRDMCDPTRLGSIDHYSQYDDSTNVHYTSGIYNKAWCILSQRTGWDFMKAFKVFTDANLMYWSSETTMHCGACGVRGAAATRGWDVDDVTFAFQQVGVYCSSC